MEKKEMKRGKNEKERTESGKRWGEKRRGKE